MRECLSIHLGQAGVQTGMLISSLSSSQFLLIYILLFYYIIFILYVLFDWYYSYVDNICYVTIICHVIYYYYWCSCWYLLHALSYCCLNIYFVLYTVEHVDIIIRYITLMLLYIYMFICIRVLVLVVYIPT